MVLSPVRAAMVASPGEWPWSSHPAMLGQVAAPPWLARAWLLSQFGRTTHQARQRYRQFVEDGQQQESIWQGLRQQIYLGDKQFVDRMQARLHT